MTCTEKPHFLRNSPALFALRQLVAQIEREIAADPPFSAANAERRGELDQLRDMIDRRT